MNNLRLVIARAFLFSLALSAKPGVARSNPQHGKEIASSERASALLAMTASQKEGTK